MHRRSQDALQDQGSASVVFLSFLGLSRRDASLMLQIFRNVLLRGDRFAWLPDRRVQANDGVI